MSGREREKKEHWTTAPNEVTKPAPRATAPRTDRGDAPLPTGRPGLQLPPCAGSGPQRSLGHVVRETSGESAGSRGEQLIQRRLAEGHPIRKRPFPSAAVDWLSWRGMGRDRQWRDDSDGGAFLGAERWGAAVWSALCCPRFVCGAKLLPRCSPEGGHRYLD